MRVTLTITVAFGIDTVATKTDINSLCTSKKTIKNLTNDEHDDSDKN